ncbi:hypothetical protein QJS04_geneDACA019094 [Acorus gramineus]|uniref:Uncharacterized protein n=1 Tax=Acorus gramineus TaxID=55184 RepID=A0AAV9A953_ACOGR|nr:hypothetical protein QJS04_geneDACA019094 [Acorus gramineus]
MGKQSAMHNISPSNKGRLIQTNKFREHSLLQLFSQDLCNCLVNHIAKGNGLKVVKRFSILCLQNERYKRVGYLLQQVARLKERRDSIDEVQLDQRESAPKFPPLLHSKNRGHTTSKPPLHRLPKPLDRGVIYSTARLLPLARLL